MQFNAPDDERNYRSKHVEQPRNNKLSYTMASSWSFSYIAENLFVQIGIADGLPLECTEDLIKNNDEII
jgi:hypothetical protein